MDATLSRTAQAFRRKAVAASLKAGTAVSTYALMGNAADDTRAISGR
nr:hypothetical protein [Nocardia tengchongensis]